MDKTYKDAQNLLEKYMKNENMRKHCYAVETAMKAYAEKYANEGKITEAEKEKWAIVGILHDFDYEKYADKHPEKGSEILKEDGWPEDIIRAILSHADYTGVERQTLMEKTLFAVDELSGFVIACALVRPDKLASLKAKSVRKKMKDKSFAAKVSRDDIVKGAEDLGVDLNQHIDFVIQALRQDDRLGL